MVVFVYGLELPTILSKIHTRHTKSKLIDWTLWLCKNKCPWNYDKNIIDHFIQHFDANKSSFFQNIKVPMNNFFLCFNIFQQTFYQIIPKSFPHNILKFYVKVLKNDELGLLLVRTHAELHYHFSVKPVFIDLYSVWYSIFSFIVPKVFLVIMNDERIIRRTKTFSFWIRWTHSSVKISFKVEKMWRTIAFRVDPKTSRAIQI